MIDQQNRQHLAAQMQFGALGDPNGMFMPNPHNPFATQPFAGLPGAPAVGGIVDGAANPYNFTNQSIFNLPGLQNLAPGGAANRAGQPPLGGLGGTSDASALGSLNIPPSGLTSGLQPNGLASENVGLRRFFDEKIF